MLKNVFLISFLFIFLFPFISATAFFYEIPDQKIEYMDTSYLYLNDYCSSDILGESCKENSYSLSFVNPDNNEQISLTNDGTYINVGYFNSYFTINLRYDGRVSIIARNKDLSTSVAVFGSDVEFTSQSSGSFDIEIAETQKPEQFQSFYLETINGFESRQYDMNSFWENYETIRIIYSDKNQTLQFSKSKGEGLTCQTGLIKVCLDGGSGNVILTIKGLNNTYNASVLGGNVMQIEAINNNGISKALLPIETKPSVAVGLTSYSDLPIRNPLTIAPAMMNFNEEYRVDLSLFYGNWQKIEVNFSIGSSVGMLRVWQNGTTMACTASGATCFGDTEDGSSWILGGTYNTRFTIYPNADFSILSQTTTANMVPLGLSAHNNIGFIHNDTFGNADILYMNITDVPPTIIPMTIQPLELNYFEKRSVDLNNYFLDFDYLVLRWNETTGDNFTLKTPSVNVNVTTYVSTEPVYQVSLYSNNLLEVESTKVEDETIIYFEVCNAIDCIFNPRGFNFNQTLTFIIRESTKTEITEDVIEDNLFRSQYNVIVGLFPDPDTLTSREKIFIVIIALSFVTGLIMLFGFASGDIKPLLVVVAFVNFFLLIFLTSLGYVNPIMFVVMGVMALLVLFFKFRGGL